MALTYPGTLETLRDRVRSRLRSSSTAKGAWTDAVIKDALNRAQVEVQGEILNIFDEHYFVREETWVNPANGVIHLPSDFIRLLTFEKMAGGIGDRNWLPITITTPSKVQEHRYATPLRTSSENVNSFAREVWIMVGDKLENQYSTATGTYKARIQYQVGDLQDDADESQIPARFHDLLVDDAAWRLAADAKDDAMEARMRESREDALDRMRRTVGRVAPTKQHRIRRTYGGPARWI